MANELEGKIAVVTGASSGIGKACLDVMVAAGAKVVAVARNREKLEALRDEHGNSVIPLSIDLLEPKSRDSLVPEALKQTGRIDIFHANAGMYVGGDLVDNDPKAISDVISLNVTAVMLNVRAVLPHMIERNSGDIVVTSSLAGHFPTSWEPIYASSKLAVNRFLEITRYQLAGVHDIRVMEVSPGPVESPLIETWPAERQAGAKEAGIIPASAIGKAVMHMLTQDREVSTDTMVVRPTKFYIYDMAGHPALKKGAHPTG